ncbi:Gypsy retrotransposon integrase-like protein 1 [Saxophila tyrrhenica]|uniref:Gypsy retrotransposon integrase-like protein 1 n=1 Tax=Saxophila tyrrhenica TaxID=1690608 RepID=A0AAV9NW00_9PEZI|nr:Gypsy retrotransposon integrase-like protein 1 [Saxophila tyrrhenica]
MGTIAYTSSLEAKVRELERLLRRSNASPGDSAEPSEQAEDYIETMVDAPSNGGSPDGPSSASDEHSGFGGQSLLRRLHALCEHARENVVFSDPPDSRPRSSNDDLTAAFDVAPPETRSSISWDAYAMLPSPQNISHAIGTVTRSACCSMQFLDGGALQGLTDKAYEAVDSGSLEPCRKELGLLFAVLALARRFDTSWSAPVRENDVATAYGARYFRASRALLNPSDCQDLVSIRTLLCMVIYTQSCSMLSACYSYICMAVAATLQMGLLDAPLSADSQDRAQASTLIPVLATMDTSVTESLGLPRTLRDIDTVALISLGRGDQFESATDGHAQLMRILAEIVETNHPPCKRVPYNNGFYGVRHSNIVEAEKKLTAWSECMERSYASVVIVDEGFLRCQSLLRLYHAHVQLVLYRPFLHHALKRARQNDDLSQKAYACGDACIKAALQVVALVEKMEADGVMNTAHWYLNLIVAHAAACLVLFTTSASQSPTVYETGDAVRRLKEFCSRHASSESSLQRCLTFLEAYSPGEPSMDLANLNELQSGFEPNLSLFSSAFNGLDDFMLNGGSGGMGGGGMAYEDHVQALSLPGFHSFVHSHF